MKHVVVTFCTPVHRGREREAKMRVSCFILTFNEEKHIARCIESLRGAVDREVVVENPWADRTFAITQRLGEEVLKNAWPDYANPINWALAGISDSSDWLFRFNADEVLTSDAWHRLRGIFEYRPPDVDGLTVRRRLRFLSNDIRLCGLGDIQILRIFRSDRGHCEARMMNKHIRVDGRIEKSDIAIVDGNLNSITWILDKYNSHSSLNAPNLRYEVFDGPREERDTLARSARRKRAIKLKLYMRFPAGFRALGYFLFRFVFQRGFIDGKVRDLSPHAGAGVSRFGRCQVGSDRDSAWGIPRCG